MHERIDALKNPRERCGVGRWRQAAHDVAGRIDPIRKCAEQLDLRMGLHEGELLAEAVGPRAVVGVESREIRRTRRRDRGVESRHDALRRLTDESDTAVGGSKTREQGRGPVIRPVVDDHQFEVAELLAAHARDGLREPFRAIAHRHDDGNGGGQFTYPFLARNAAPTSSANVRKCHTPASPTRPIAQNAKWKSAAVTSALSACVSVATRSMTALPATPSAFPIC